MCVLLCVNADYLHAQDSKDNKEGAADKHNVPDGSKRGDESLHNELQSWCSTDYPRKHTLKHTNVFSTSMSSSDTNTSDKNMKYESVKPSKLISNIYTQTDN